MTPSPSRLWADISNWTSRFDAWPYASAGHLQVGVLVTDGPTFLSPKAAEQIARAHEAGLVVVAYHFCRPSQDPAGVGEAAHFWRHAKPMLRDGDRVCLDLEEEHPDGIHAAARYLGALDARLHSISGHSPIGYTFDAYLREHGPSLQVRSRLWWIANYGGRIASLGAGRRLWAAQYTDGALGDRPHTFAGIGACDGSVLNRRTARALARRVRRRRHYA